MSWTPQHKTMVVEAVQTAHKEVLEEKVKVMDARKIVPFMAKADKWTSVLKYWAVKGNTELEIKSKTDTEGNNINLQMRTIDSTIPRFPVEFTVPYVVFKEYQNQKSGLINYIKAHIEEGYKAYNLFTNDFCLIGNENGFSGLVNDNQISKYNFQSKLNSVNGSDLFVEVNKFLNQMVKDSEKTFEPHQLAVSTNFYTKLVSTTIGSNAMTVLDKLLKESPYLRNSRIAEADRIIQLSELDGAGVGGIDRIIALADSENGSNYHFEETMRMELLTEGFDAKKYYKEWENRSGGLMIDQLKSIKYGDIALT